MDETILFDCCYGRYLWGEVCCSDRPTPTSEYRLNTFRFAFPSDPLNVSILLHRNPRHTCLPKIAPSFPRILTPICLQSRATLCALTLAVNKFASLCLYIKANFWCVGVLYADYCSLTQACALSLGAIVDTVVPNPGAKDGEDNWKVERPSL